MIDPSTSVLVQCRTPQEAEVAIAAIMAFRTGKKPGMGAATAVPTSATTSLPNRIEVALRGAPSNPQKTLLLQLLFEVADDEWVPFDKIKKAFAKAGLKTTQAAAALRDLSWQMREFLPSEDVAGLDAFICVLAERTRSGGAFNYRLTAAGRTAVSRFLGH